MKTIIKVLFGIIVFLILWGIFCYIKVKVEKKGQCMIIYVNNYYPNGYAYKVDGIPHIDKPGLNYEKIGKVNGCFVADIKYALNIPYCYVALIGEKILNNK